MAFLNDQSFIPYHVALFNRSQSRYLCRMVTDYFEAIGGPDAAPDFFAECAEGLLKEYQFWTLARLHASGLSHYGHHGTWADEENLLQIIESRSFTNARLVSGCFSRLQTLLLGLRLKSPIRSINWH